MHLKLFLVFSFLFFTNSPEIKPSFWGKNGHRATAKIAEQHLTKRSKKKIDKILQGMSLAFVSTFADEIKSDKKYNQYYSWHYINMGLEETYASAEKNPEGDLVTGIEHCIAVLKDKNSSTKDQEFFLKMLIHFVGDLHQPMHIGQKEDKGGNTIQLQWFGKGTNLHRVWDENMIDDWEMSYIELANNAKKLSKNQIEALQKGSIEDWVNEVHQVTKEVYKSVEVGENLRYKYSYDYFETVRTQLQKGGVRLAKILNDIYN